MNEAKPALINSQAERIVNFRGVHKLFQKVYDYTVDYRPTLCNCGHTDPSEKSHKYDRSVHHC